MSASAVGVASTQPAAADDTSAIFQDTMNTLDALGFGFTTAVDISRHVGSEVMVEDSRQISNSTESFSIIQSGSAITSNENGMIPVNETRTLGADAAARTLQHAAPAGRKMAQVEPCCV